MAEEELESPDLQAQPTEADVAEEEELGIEEKEPQEEAPTSECPPCKSGAPAWMATFADMATLLMAFFVLLLSFAHVNVPKYKEVSGSMKTKFGVQTVIPDMEPPKARNIVVTQYMSAKAEPTAMQTVQEQRTDEPQPEDEELKFDTGDGETDVSQAIETLEEQLAQQIAEGKVRVTTENNMVKVEVLENIKEGTQQGQNSGSSPGQISQDRIEIYAAVAEAQTRTTSQIQITDSALTRTAQAQVSGSSSQGASAEDVSQSRYEQIRASLSQQINQGLAQVEKEGDKVIIRLAEQGSFESGQAELQRDIMGLLNEVGVSLTGDVGLVSIEGHTDNIPLAYSERFKSNWDLSAARAAAVADYLLNGDFVQPGKVNVIGYADTKPVADNASITGRAQNRRIEIIVNN
jgi:chemotaxis protein MotB